MTTISRATLGVLATGALLALGACTYGDPVSPAGTASGASQLVAGAASASTLPNGTATAFGSFGGLAADLPNALGRRQTDAVYAQRTRAWSKTNNFWSWWHGDFRNGDLAGQMYDPRLPVPQSTTADDNPAADIQLYQPTTAAAYPDGEYWELFEGQITGLEPGGKYFLAFAQRTLQVNGVVDQVDRILNGTVAEPDVLTLRPGGTPGRANSDWSSGCVGGDTFPGKNTNPFMLGPLTASGLGNLNNVDKCWLPGDALWTSTATGTQSLSMIGRADDQPYDLPNYNYLEVWKDTVEGPGTLVARIQIAQDIDANGVPVPNTYPPFPAPNSAVDPSDGGQGPVPAVEAVDAYPIVDTLKAQLPGAISLPDSASLTLNNLQPLDSGVYKIFYVNATTGAAHPATGRVVYSDATTGAAIDSVADVSEFNGRAGTNITFVSNGYQADIAPLTFADSLQFIVVSRVDAGAATPGPSQPLWAKLFKIPPGTAGGALIFGSFNNGAARQRFTPQGTATGGVLGDTVGFLDTATVEGTVVQVHKLQFNGSRLELKFQQLARPPVGYEYRAFLIPGDTTTRTIVDLGGITDLAGHSLEGADTATVLDNNLTATAIRFAKLTYDAHANQVGGAADNICAYKSVKVKLVPKAGTMSPEPPVTIFSITLPALVTGADRCQ